MAMNRVKLDSAKLGAKAKSKRLLARHRERFNAPLVDAQIAIFWQTLPAAEKARLRQVLPQQAAELDRLYGGKNGSGV